MPVPSLQLESGILIVLATAALAVKRVSVRDCPIDPLIVLKSCHDVNVYFFFLLLVLAVWGLVIRQA